MTVISAVGSFAVVAGLLTIIRGLDTALVLRTGVVRGNAPAFLTAFGIGTGSLIWGVAAAVGISALLTASTAAYTALRIVGAGYMIWLGGRIIWASAVGQLSATDIDTVAEPAAGYGCGRSPSTVAAASAGWRSWRQGLLTNLLNPKIGAFYLSVLPQFIPAHTSPLAMGLLLAFVHDLEGLAWFTLIILGTHGIRTWLRRRSVERSVDGLTGVALIGFGLKLGLSSRS